LPALARCNGLPIMSLRVLLTPAPERLRRVRSRQPLALEFVGPDFEVGFGAAGFLF